jgi:Mg-chelatase subunit ChlD
VIATAALASWFGIVTLVAMALAAIGLCAVASARPIARAAAWPLVLLFVVVASWQPRVDDGEAPARRGAAVLVGDPARARTELLVAAAASDPSAEHLLVTSRAPLAPDLGGGVLGARAVQPPALPFQPEELQVQALGPIVAGRPLALQVLAPALSGASLPAELRVRADDVEVLRAPIALGSSAPPPVSFLVPDAVALTVELVVPLPDAEITVRGGAAIAPAPTVLVLEPTGLAAAALQAQGVRVVTATAPPAEWRDVAAVVLGQPLPAAAQQELVAAVLDGVGLFALAPAFGTADEPLRAILPVRPAATQPTIADGTGSERRPAPTPSNEPPPNDPPPSETPPPPKPPTNEPPAGDTQGAQMAKDPIEVDKRSIAMVLVVDRSGSMGNVLPNGRTKMSYAKSSALRTAQALGEGDQVAIVTYGNKGQGRIELPMTAATAVEAVQNGVEQLAHASELTFLLGGLQVAEQLLRGTTAAVKHVVVITDGEFDTSEDIALRALARRMRNEQKASVSVIAITDAFTGSGFRKLSEELTKDGGGQFLPTDDPTTVPVFVVAEVTRALKRVGRKPRAGDGSATAGAGNVPPTNAPPTPPPPKPPQPEPPKPEAPSPRRLAVRAVAESPLLLPAPAAAWPMLGSALAGTAPLDAQVLLVAGDDGWPLLAYGNRGLGRVGAFAADLCGNDGGEFRSDAAFPGRLAAWVQSVLPALPTGAPQALQREVQVTPERPTPRDRALLAQLAGSEPMVEAPASVPPRATRSLVAVEPDLAPWLVAGLVLLAALERWSAWRALRRVAS